MVDEAGVIERKVVSATKSRLASPVVPRSSGPRRALTTSQLQVEFNRDTYNDTAMECKPTRFPVYGFTSR